LLDTISDDRFHRFGVGECVDAFFGFGAFKAASQ
jgi:hypothetical protein